MRRTLVVLVMTCVLVLPSCSGDTSVSPDAARPQATWRVQNPVPVTSRLAAVWGSGSRDVFAVDYHDPNIIHYDGVSWELALSGGGYGSTDIWGTSGQDVYAVGRSVRHFDGISWTELTVGVPEPYRLEAVWGSSENNVYFVGFGGLLIHYDGADFERIDLGTDDRLLDVWCSEPGDVYVLGTDRLFHFNGAAWDTVAVGDPSAYREYDCIAGYSTDNVVLAGQRCAVYDGRSWDAVPRNTTDPVTDMWCSGRDEYYCASGRRVYRFDGRTWQELFELPSGKSVWLVYGVWRDSRGTLYAVGERGVVWKFRTGQLTLENRSVSNITDIWAASRTDVYYGTEAGEVFHWDGREWRQEDRFTDGPIVSLWGLDGDRVYAADGHALYRYNGARWREVETPSGLDPMDVWESSERTIVVAGRYGLARRDARGWSVDDIYGGAGSVWGRNAADVFAATQAGLFHHDGRDWSMVKHDMGDIYDLWGPPSGQIYAAAAYGLYVHFEGEWGRVPATPNGYTHRVWGELPEALYFLFSYGLVYFNDGRQSEEVYDPERLRLEALWGTGPDDVYVGGWNGLLVRYGADR